MKHFIPHPYPIYLPDLFFFLVLMGYFQTIILVGA